MIDRARRAAVTFPVEELVELLDLPPGLVVLDLYVDQQRDALTVIVQHDNLDRVPPFDEAPRLLDFELERIVNPPPPPFIGPPTKAQAQLRAMTEAIDRQVLRALGDQRFIAEKILADTPGEEFVYYTED